MIQKAIGRSALGAAILLCLGSVASFADVIVTPGNNPIFQVVNFNNGDTGTTVTGTTAGGFGLDVIGSQTLEVQGQHIQGQGNTNYTNVTFEPTAGVIFNLIVNFNVTTAGSITFSSAPFGIVGTDTFSVGAGQNFFTLSAINGQDIASVTANVTGTEIQDVRQIRVGTTAAVPEPGTIGTVLAGLGAAVLGLRRRKKA